MLLHIVVLSWLLGLTAERVASRGRPSAGAGNLGAGSLSHRVGAPVHLVDNGGVGVGEVGASDVGASNDGQVVQVLGHDGEFTAAESRGSVVHERAVVVGHAKVGSARNFVKVESHVAGDIAKEDVQVVVTVRSALFVVETDGVAQFVSDDSRVGAATSLKGHLVRTMVVANAGVTSLAAEDGDVVAVSGRASFSTAGLHESDASLSHPHLHTGVNGIDLAGRESTGNLVRDDSFGPSVIVAGHSRAGKSLQFSVFDFVLGRVHVHVHVEVDFLVLTGGLGSSSGGSSGGNDLVNSPVIVTVFDGEFSVQDFICAESFLELHLFSRDEAESQEGNEKV